MSWYTSGKFWSFVGGVGAAALAKVIAAQPQTRKFAVSAVAKGIECKQIADDSIQSFKEDAEDLAAEARQKALAEAELADRRALIEKRVREQVEAELAAEEA